MRAGEYGVTLTLQAGVDLTNATAAKLHRVAPDGVQDVKTVTPVPPAQPTQGNLSYTTGTTDFPLTKPGEWQLMLEVDFGAGQKLKSDLVLLNVEPALA